MERTRVKYSTIRHHTRRYTVILQVSTSLRHRAVALCQHVAASRRVGEVEVFCTRLVVDFEEAIVEACTRRRCDKKQCTTGGVCTTGVFSSLFFFQGSTRIQVYEIDQGRGTVTITGRTG